MNTRNAGDTTIRQWRPITFLPLVLIDGRSTTQAFHSVQYSLRHPDDSSSPRKARRISLARRFIGAPLSFRSSRSDQHRVFEFAVVPGTFTCRPSVTTFLSASASSPSDDSTLLDPTSSDPSPIPTEPAARGTPLPPPASYSMRSKVPEVLATAVSVKNRTLQQSRISADPSPPARGSPSSASASPSAAAAPKPSRPSQPCPLSPAFP